jgi:predicted neutral ceramidase superfamily lipid hydrolase
VLRPPNPEVVAGLWRAVWGYALSPFRAVAPEGIAELMLVATLLTAVALLCRYYVLRRLVYVALVALWAFLLFSLVLYYLGLPPTT